MRIDPETTAQMSDRELLDLFIETGRADYFGLLYGRYIPLVYGLCLKYLKRPEAAEDAVMQIFEDTMPKVGRLYVREFRTWLYTVARNHCLQLLRVRKREIRLDATLPVMESDDLLHLFNKRDDEAKFEALEACLEALPAPQRKSITLFFLEGKSYAEVSDATKYAVKSVKSHIQNGKRNLRNCLEKNGIRP